MTRLTLATAPRRRIALTFGDQVVSSASNFTTGVVVARLAGATAFGQYMLTLMIWLVVVGIHRAVITEPVIVTSRSIADRRSLVAHGVTAEIILGATISVVVGAGGLALALSGARIGVLMLALSPWFIPLLVQDYWRAMAFQERRPGLALTDDLVFAGVQLAFVGLFLATGWRTAPAMIFAWGLGSLAGAVLGFRWSPLPGAVARGFDLTRRMWPMSRWMLADFLTGFASDQAFLIFVALLLTGADYGGFRAATSLMGPTVVILLAGGNIGLPEASRSADPADWRPLRRLARRLTAGTSACVAAYAVVVSLAGGRLLRLLYGSSFSHFGPLATLVSVEYIALVSVFGQGIALKAASRMRLVWVARLGVAAASLVSMFVLVRWLGVIGAGWAAVATGCYYAAAVYGVYRVELGAPEPGDGGLPGRGSPGRSGPRPARTVAIALAVLAGCSLLGVGGLRWRAGRTPAHAAGASPPRSPGVVDPPARICGNALLLDGPESPPDGSVRVDPGQNLNDVTQAHGEATTFWLSPGTYSLGTSTFGQVIPKNDDTYIGAPGAVLDGHHVNRSAFTQHATGVTIRSLTIQNFGSAGKSQNEGVVNHDGGEGWTIERNTVRDNAGAGVFVGSHDIVRQNCLQANGQYGFSLYSPVPGSLGDVVLDHNEITGNDTDDWETRSPGCGCSGGGKFWDSHAVRVTSNWVHDNRGVGLWADTNNYGFTIDGNAITDNDAEGIFFELSYNSRITNNTLVGNAIVKGKAFAARKSTFPVGAMYISESGGDARVDGGRNPTLDIMGNVLTDNWGGVVLWENADRFCGNGFSTRYCTLVDPAAVNLGTCTRANIRRAPYNADCRWKTQNVNVSHNQFVFHKQDVGCRTTTCGQQALLANYGSFPAWSPYKGRVVQDAVSYRQHNRFADNTYLGDWSFTAYESGSRVAFSTWQAKPYGQDAGTTKS